MASRIPRSDSKPPATPVANVASTNSSTTSTSSPLAPDSVTIGGLTYHLSSSTTPATANVAVSRTASAHIETVPSDSDNSMSSSLYSYHSYLAISGPPTALVDWTSILRDHVPSDTDALPVVSRTLFTFHFF